MFIDTFIEYAPSNVASPNGIAMASPTRTSTCASRPSRRVSSRATSQNSAVRSMPLTRQPKRRAM
jgi:hypothetical protein